MKAPDFGYVRPASLREALELLAADDNAVPLAGGQSLLAALNLRLSAPSVLVDIGRLPELRGLHLAGEIVRVGALTRHVDLAQSPLVAEHLPLLKEAIHHVAHAAVRNRGTIGGSFAHFDPAAELPACAVALDATIVLAGPDGRRNVPARRFFRGLFDTAREPGELIVEVLFRTLRPSQRCAFMELSRRRGDFAMVGLAASLLIRDGMVEEADLVYFGASQPPLLLGAASRELRGRPLTGGQGWIEGALAAELDRSDAPGLRSETKLKLASTLTRRVLDQLAGMDPSFLSAEEERV